MASKHYLERELEALFRSDANMWRFLQEGSLDGVWYWDLEHPDREWMSPEFWRLFGIDPATKTHDPAEWQDIIFAEDLQLAMENFERHCADPDCPYDQIVRYRHADGSTVWVRCRGIAIRDDSGRPIRMLGAHTDLTPLERKAEEAREGIERERRLERQKRVAERANDELRAFAYAVSHELKAPSNTTRMLLSEVLDHGGGGLDDEGRDLLVTALRTIDGMRDLIDELLRYTSTIGQDLVFKPLNLDRILATVLGDLAGEIEEADADVSVRELPGIEGHEIQIRALMQNLLSNALKFRRPDARCRIVVEGIAHENASMVTLSVRDNGIGIPRRSRERIFGLFKRLHAASEVPGIGLGLASCRRIAANHGGDIVIRDNPTGEGCRFDVHLARRPSHHD